MRIKAKKSFCGALTMAAGEERDYSNEAITKDLLEAGYIEEVKEKKDVSNKKMCPSSIKGQGSNESK